MEEEMTQQLGARQCERNGHARYLAIKADSFAHVHAPRAYETRFLVKIFDRYRRATGLIQEVMLETHPQRASTWEVEVTVDAPSPADKPSAISISQDAASRIAQRLDRALEAWRTGRLTQWYLCLNFCTASSSTTSAAHATTADGRDAGEDPRRVLRHDPYSKVVRLPEREPN
jgi:transposase-like protein